MIACATVVAAHAATSPAQPVERHLIVGLDDDTAKWRTQPDRLLSTYRQLGIDAVRLTIPWRRGQNRPTWEVGVYLHRAAAMVARGQRVVLPCTAALRRPPSTTSSAGTTQRSFITC
jgi:hypothetical protein